MGKQPYIPIYVGDYLKDTRVLPLSVRGAWVDLILFMWENPVRGELVGTIDEFARIMSCSPKEAEDAIQILMKKKTADITLADGVWTIVSRRMKADAALGQKRSEASNQRWKKEKDHDEQIEVQPKAITAGDIPSGFDDWFSMIFSEMFVEAYKRDFKSKNVDEELKQFKLKVKNNFEHYRNRDSGGIRTAFQYQLKTTAKDKSNDTGTSTKAVNGVKSFSGKNYSAKL